MTLKAPKIKPKRQPRKASSKIGRNEKVLIKTDEGKLVVAKYKNVKNEDFGRRLPFNKLHRNVLSSAKPPSEKGLGDRTAGRTKARKVTVTPEDLERIYNEQEGKCALTGVHLDLNLLYVSNAIMAPSVDRINSNGEYTADDVNGHNIHIVMRGINHFKMDAGMHETATAIQAIQDANKDLSELDLPNFEFSFPDYEEIFENPISEIIMKTEYGYVKILTGSMNIGKTYTAFNTLIPELMVNKGVKLFYYYAPLLENIDEGEFNDYIEMNVKPKYGYENIGAVKLLTLGGESGYNWDHVEEYLRKDYTVIVGSTDKTLKRIMDDNRKLEYIQNLGDKVCMIRDEIHYGSCSDASLYKDVVGGTGTKYKAQMFHMFLNLIDTTPWLFGFSATPTKEMLDENFGAAEYKVLNEWVAPSNLTGVSAWVNRITHSLNLQSYEDETYILGRLQRVVNSLVNRTSIVQRLVETNSSEYPFLDKVETKTTGLIAVDTTVGDGNPKKAYLNKILRLLKKTVMPVNFEYVETTKDGWKVYNHKGKLVNQGKGNGWKTLMNNPDSNVRLVIVVMKGSMGVNIPSLTDGVIFRNPKMKDSMGSWIVRNSIQLFGRFVRKNWGGLTLDEVQYELPGELATDILHQLNTFDLDVPDSPQWKQTVAEFNTEYASHMADIFGFGTQRKTKVD